MNLFAWMLYGLVVGLLVTAAAWLLDRAFGRANLPTRWIWAGALALSIGIPGAALIAPGGPPAAEPENAFPAAVVGTDAASADADASTSVGLIARAFGFLVRPADWPALALAGGAAALEGVGAARDGAGAALNQAIERGTAMLPSIPGAQRAGLAAWGLGSTALGAFLLFSLARLGRRRAIWPLAHVRGRRVRIAPELGPAVLGLRQPEIVLPRWATRLEPEELDLVLAHEGEHLRARDPLLLAAGLAAVVAVPWNPAAWWQLQRLRDAVEVDCDRRVLRGGAPAKHYGSLLVRLGGQGWKDLLPAAPLGGTPSLLERRLNAMKKRSVRTAVPLALLAVVAATGLLVLACEADTPTHLAEEADLSVAEAEAGPADAEYIVVAPLFPDVEDRPLLVVDGVIVSQRVVDGLDSERIDHIEVLKGAAAAAQYGERAANGVVLITTEGAPAPAAGSEDEEPQGAAAELTGLVNGATARARPDDSAAAADPGAAEEGVRVRLRTPASLDANEETPPLFVVDGVIMSRNAVDLDAMDIESIEVVKGAAAAELYGSRAASGVVLVTTRRR